MPRQLTYQEHAQTTKQNTDTIRDTLHAWHDPSNDNYLVYLREEAIYESDGSHATNSNGQRLFEVSLAAQLRGVEESGLSAQITNLVNAINDAFPSSWPTVDETQIIVE
jgi:hypothetical protein